MNPQPNRFFQMSLILLVALNLVPHFADYTVPTLAVGGLCLAWRLLYEYQIVPLPNFFTKMGLVAALTYLVYENYGQILGLESGSALLICAVSLKLIDRVGYRDAMVMLFLNFMLLLARFFESQSLGITIFAGFDLIITTALLVQLHNGSQIKFNFLTLLKTGSKLFLQVTPFMVLLFFVFPRFSTGFLSAKTNRPALDGFSESMEPGTMSRLAQTDQPAFRVRFFGSVPSSLDRYWRGGVLSVNQGMRWEKGAFLKSRAQRPGRLMKGALKHEILQEPVFNDWMFTLERGIWVEQRNALMQSKTQVSEGGVFSLNKPYDRKYVYDVYSNQILKEELSLELKKVFLQTPQVTDKRVLDLVRKISQDNATPEQKAERLMGFYQKQFRYTLSPGRMTTNKVGEFLFEKRLGFCEHFAVSFASLMRLAGVPARVVVGFQGGVKNRLSDYYLVTSKDAHAWTEIWSESKSQWLRYDPTLVVAPLRFELGGQVYHSMTGEERSQVSDGQEYLLNYQWGLFEQTYFALDALATNWNRFLLHYDQQGQKEFFAKMGLENVNQDLLLSVSLLVLLCFFLWVRLRSRKEIKTASPSQKAYLSLRTRLAKKGIEKEVFEGPSDFLKRVEKTLPEKKEAIKEFRDLYLEGYYGKNENKQSIQACLKEIK